MSELSPIFQTLEDRDNPDKVEQHGPYQSEMSHWLGKGYYFWDRNITRAHWWGRKAKFHKDNLRASFILRDMREKGNFPFKIMRVETSDCGGDQRYYFNGHSFLNTNKAIQLCIYDKSLIHDYHIVYPTDYTIPIG